MYDGFHDFPKQEKKPKNKAKELGLEALLELGADPRHFNLKENGVTITQFNKLCLKIYKKAFDIGYEKGLAKQSNDERIERQGTIMDKFKKTSKLMSESNVLNKRIK